MSYAIARFGLYALGQRCHAHHALVSSFAQAKSACFMSTAKPSVTDQMIDYAVRQCKGKHEQAVDVIRSGLSMHPEQRGVDAARLLVALSSVEADRSNWAGVLDATRRADGALAGQALAAGDSNAACTRLHSGMASLQALLIQGKDEEARAAAQATASALAPAAPPSPSVPPPHAYVRALGMVLSSQHATGDFEGAACSAATLNGLMQGLGDSPPPAALLALAHWQTRSGNAAADGLYRRAAQLAEDARAKAAPLVGALDTESHFAELQAGALVGTAQLAMVASPKPKWDEAEEVLGKALSAAESVSTDTHPRVVPVLTLLGYVYCRTARHTFGEGLMRECAKILKLEPGKYVPPGTSPAPALLHPSLVAAAAWRHAQLLYVMPNRGGEASSWEKVAREAWSHAGIITQPPAAAAASTNASQDAASPAPAPGSIEDVLGGKEHLKGKGTAGRGMLVALQLRRALPM